MRPTYLLLLLVLCTSAALPAAQAQQAVTATPPAQAMYGSAEVSPGLGGWFLILSDGTTPNPKNKILEDNQGKNRRFEDEAAVLNFLYAQGWEVLPNGIFSNNNRHYLLKRRSL